MKTLVRLVLMIKTIKLPLQNLVWFGFMAYHSILGYFIPNPTYIEYMISKHILEITFLNEPELILFQINGFSYLFVIRIILFTIHHLNEHSLMFSSITTYQ